MKLIDAFPSPATVCRCWTGTFGGPWSQWVPIKLRLYNAYILPVFLSIWPIKAFTYVSYWAMPTAQFIRVSQWSSLSFSLTVTREVLTSLGNSGLCWTVSARNRDTAVPAEGNGDLQTLICVLVARPRWCLTLSNPVPWQNWMAPNLGYTLQMKMLFRGWPIMVNDMHTRRRRSGAAYHSHWL